MSTIFTLSGKKSTLSADFNPPIYLDDDSEYVLGLLSFETYNTIPNIEKPNNVFQFINKPPINIPTGAYELHDIEEVIQSKLGSEGSFTLRGNNGTLRTILKSSLPVDFSDKTSIGELLGFEPKRYEADRLHTSEHITKIMKINAILIHCNITVGSFKNGKPGHIIHQFFPTVPPGFKIVETPNPVIYLPISTKTITNITVKILDQDDKPVSFSEETLTVGLHLKKL